MNLQLVVIEWMYTAVRQSDQCTVKYGAAPHTWRNDSAELHERDTPMTQQTSGTQVCMESEGHIETYIVIGVQILKGIETYHYTMNIKKALKYVNNFESYQLRNLCTAGSGKHF